MKYHLSLSLLLCFLYICRSSFPELGELLSGKDAKLLKNAYNRALEELRALNKTAPWEEILKGSLQKGPGRLGEPDEWRNVTQLITSKGYGCEEHTVTTSDGYVLGLQRILPREGVVRNFSTVVVLQHGILDSSNTWVINQANNSLGFLLSDQGYDVWLFNSRGNVYSDKNTKPWYDPLRRREYWAFTWDEMAAIDLPDSIDYVTAQTGVDQVYYVGHSQGTTIAFTGFSDNTKLAAKIKRFFALAPVAWVKHIEGPIAWIAPLHGVVYFWLDLFGIFDIFPSNTFDRNLGRSYCGTTPGTCELLTMWICGPDWAGYNTSRSDVYFSHFPAGTSIRNINHWGQMVESGKLRKYDYGWFENPFYYHGKHYPPKYDITKLSVPTALFSGGNDYFADPKDVEKLRGEIADAIVFDKTIPYFNHLDFVWGMTATEEVYNDIISQIQTTA